ncbi:MAG: VWA domain-containing protein [Planctomycetaceae bacterium]|nr:VWA domain-containing protein [Planctomycetales bacterium]MCB9926578.1 VWA domain-containing protein [Planctomycetaceae bacterium]
MLGLEIGFDKPWYLVLLTVLPVLWMMSFRSLAGLGNIRRLFALGFRTLVLTLIVMCLAEVQLRKTSEKLTVIYLLDQSESIPLAKRQEMLQYVVDEVSEHRHADREDRAGVIVFGRNANIEIPPFDDDIAVLGGIDSYINLNTDATNLEAALKLAQASFTEDSAKRIVVVTDGNENIGDARTIASMLADDGIGIDVAPVKLTVRAEVAVEKVTLPPDIRKGQPFETRVIVNNYADHSIPGKLRVTRRVGSHEEFLGEIDVDLPPGKTPYSFPHEIEQPAVYTYQADFTPTHAEDDLMVQNNRATAFTHVRGKGRVLFIENFENPGDFDFLIDRLRNNNIEVDSILSNELFSSLAELQTYDSVVLANVPRGSGSDADSVASFSDAQIEMLVRNTEQMGCGLIMLGGPDSFGAGGWANTDLEKAMPVDFQIKNSKIRAVGALALMMHASELAEGNFWQKEVASVAIKALGPMDYCGLLHWDISGDRWLWGEPQGLIQVGSRRDMMLARLGRMQPGDMPEFEPAMKKALTSFNRINASVKHMIVISDGDPSPPGFATVGAYKKANVQVSTVAVGTHGPAGSKVLQDLAQDTGGRYYVVKNPKALPKIYQSEVRRVARPLVFEPDVPVSPQVVDRSHEIVQGVDNLPPISGFVLTTAKDNPLVETLVLSPQPQDERNATILAAWTYHLGRTAVLTTDTGTRWATRWTDWENYDKLFTQLVRWSMRPVNDQGKFTVATDVRDGKVSVIVTALDTDDEFLNFLNMSSSALAPDLSAKDVKIQQVAPGRYVGEFDATDDGNYFITISPGPGQAPLLTGVNVPYSSEFRERETNMALLKALAAIPPKGGEPGILIEKQDANGTRDDLLAFDTFREGLPPSISSQDVWPFFLVLAAGVFFADVFVRRVTISLEWIGPATTWLRVKIFGQEEQERHEERLDRLRSRKAAIAGEIDERRAATRFEPSMPEDGTPTVTLDEVMQDVGGGMTTGQPPQRPATQLSPESIEEESYTSRLLKAKQKAWKDNKDKE